MILKCRKCGRLFTPTAKEHQRGPKMKHCPDCSVAKNAYAELTPEQRAVAQRCAVFNDVVIKDRRTPRNVWTGPKDAPDSAPSVSFTVCGTKTTHRGNYQFFPMGGVR